MAGPARFTPTGLQPGSAETFATFVQGTPSAKTPFTGTELVPLIQNGFPVHAPPGVFGTTPLIRTILTADTNYYVALTGNDSNPGTLASPWATIQHAFNFIQSNIDGGGFGITINVGAGTFAGASASGFPTACNGISILGAGATTIINDTGSGFCLDFSTEGIFNYDNLTIKAEGTFGVTIGFVASNINTTISGGFNHAVTYNANVASVFAVANFNNICILNIAVSNFSGTWQAAMFANGQDTFLFQSGGVAFVGGPTFTDAFIELANVGSGAALDGTTFSGAVTGNLFKLTQFSFLLDTSSGYLGTNNGTVTNSWYTGTNARPQEDFQGNTRSKDFTAIPTTFANLPATPTQGMMASITDGLAGNCADGSCTTFGTNVTGGTGALKLMLWYNGTHWTLMGK